MNGKELLKELKSAAEILGMPVREKSFRNIGIPVKSGYCRIHEEDLFLLDRNMNIADKNRILKEILRRRFPHGPDSSPSSKNGVISEKLRSRIWPKPGKTKEIAGP